MAYFNFLRLIKKYSSEFKLIIYKDSCYDDTGEYIKNEKVEYELNGAIIGFKESKIFRSEGTLTSKDKRLFTFMPLCESLLDTNVIYKGNKYYIESATENALFTDVYTYNLKFISSFDEDGDFND